MFGWKGDPGLNPRGELRFPFPANLLPANPYDDSGVQRLSEPNPNIIRKPSIALPPLPLDNTSPLELTSLNNGLDNNINRKKTNHTFIPKDKDKTIMDPTFQPPGPPASSSSSSPTTTFPPLPKLEILNPSTLTTHRFLRPAKRINEGPDVSQFLTSKAYRDIGVWILQLNHALVPRIKKSTTTTREIKNEENKANESSEPPKDALAAKLQLLRKKKDDQPKEEITTFPLPSRRREGKQEQEHEQGQGQKEDQEDQEDPEPESIKKLQQLLQKVEAIIDEAPPDPGPRRFGNVSFRTWYKILEARADGLLREYLPQGVLRWEQTDATKGEEGKVKREGGEEEEGTETETETETEGDGDRKTNEQKKEEVVGPLEELKAYFLGGFGSAQRLDYGTGHELSFMMFLGGLWKMGGFEGEENDEDGEVERRIVLGVVEP